MQTAYREFLVSKAAAAPCRGFESIPALSSHLFDFQQASVAHLLRVGSGGLFLDTGLGKTLCQLEWSEHARGASNGRALILTPLAVARQIEREAARFGYPARVIRDASEVREGISICNYDRLHLLDPDAFGVVSLDESSILKSFTGKTTRALIDAFAGHRWRLSASATPAPNDHMELGQHAEFCGVMASNEMLSRFFINDTATASQQWRLKGHAVEPFWNWMASWSRMAQMPSDLGGSDDGFILPPLKVHRHRAHESAPSMTGGLFGDEIVSATNIAAIKRATTDARVAVALKIIEDDFDSGSVAWQSAKTPNIAHPNNLHSAGLTPGANTPTPTRPTGRTASGDEPKREPHPTGRSNEQINTCDSSSGSNFKTTEQCSTVRMDVAPSAEPANLVETGNSTSITVTKQDLSEDCSVTDAMSPSDSSETTPRIWIGRSTTSAILTRESWVLWCDLNSEQESIERALTDRFGKESFFSVKGSDSSDDKEDRIYRWSNRERPILVTKPSVCGFGMNFQHCARTVFVGRSFSYESWYQAVRRFWRFGQKRPVDVHLIVAEGEDTIGRVIDRKASDHTSMRAAMRAAMQRDTQSASHRKVAYNATHQGALPSWLSNV